jgi:threonine dehydrogenase-like Zn-dependent dehydrogenase
MKGLWLENQRLTFSDDLPDPAPRHDEALIRVLLAGICNTDLEMVRGYVPFTGVPGHEFVGRVVASDDSAWMGRRVVGEINIVCGECEECLAGRTTHCLRRTTLGIHNRHGCFAEMLALPLRNLHLVPDSISDEQAVFAEPLAAALEILEQVHLRPTDRVLVLGDGKLGNLVAQVISQTGVELFVVGRHAEKLALLQRLGIHTGFAGDVTPRMADLVVECTGHPSGFGLARRALRPRGTLVLKSTYHGEASLDLSSLVVDEITLIGSRCGPMSAAVASLAAQRVELGSLISQRFALQEGVPAFDRAAMPGVMKVLLHP